MQPGDVPVTYADTTALEEDLDLNLVPSLRKRTSENSLNGIRYFIKYKKTQYH